MMESDEQLRQLAHLLRVGAEAGRRLGVMRGKDRETLEALADEAIAIAERLELIARGELSS